jgi:hypothetical protein
MSQLNRSQSPDPARADAAGSLRVGSGETRRGINLRRERYLLAEAAYNEAKATGGRVPPEVIAELLDAKADFDRLSREPMSGGAS